jgi:hypothetical protein
VVYAKAWNVAYRRDRDAGWTHEEYLAALLDREVAARASGAQLRIRATAPLAAR